MAAFRPSMQEHASNLLGNMLASPQADALPPLLCPADDPFSQQPSAEDGRDSPGLSSSDSSPPSDSDMDTDPDAADNLSESSGTSVNSCERPPLFSAQGERLFGRFDRTDGLQSAGVTFDFTKGLGVRHFGNIHRFEHRPEHGPPAGTRLAREVGTGRPLGIIAINWHGAIVRPLLHPTTRATAFFHTKLAEWERLVKPQLERAEQQRRELRMQLALEEEKRQHAFKAGQRMQSAWAELKRRLALAELPLTEQQLVILKGATETPAAEEQQPSHPPMPLLVDPSAFDLLDSSPEYSGSVNDADHFGTFNPATGLQTAYVGPCPVLLQLVCWGGMREIRLGRADRGLDDKLGSPVAFDLRSGQPLGLAVVTESGEMKEPREACLAGGVNLKNVIDLWCMIKPQYGLP